MDKLHNAHVGAYKLSLNHDWHVTLYKLATFGHVDAARVWELDGASIVDNDPCIEALFQSVHDKQVEAWKRLEEQAKEAARNRWERVDAELQAALSPSPPPRAEPAAPIADTADHPANAPEPPELGSMVVYREAGMTSMLTANEHKRQAIERQARHENGHYIVSEVAQTLEDTYGLNAKELLIRMESEYYARNLTVRSRASEAPHSPGTTLRPYDDLMFPDDIRALLAHWKWSREFPFPTQDAAPTKEVATPAPVAAASASVIRHSTKVRRNTLTPVIELAQSKCRNPQDTAEVWAALQVLAEAKTAPLIGATEDGLQYLNGGIAEIFKRKSLGQRLAR